MMSTVDSLELARDQDEWWADIGLRSDQAYQAAKYCGLEAAEIMEYEHATETEIRRARRLATEAASWYRRHLVFKGMLETRGDNR